MLQFNTVACIASTKFTSRLWWRLSIPLTTKAATIPEPASKLKQVTKKVERTSPEQCTDFEEFKTKLCSSLHTKSSIVINIQKAKNVKDLMEMTKTSLLSPEDNATIDEAINTWMKKNEKVEENHSSGKSSLNEQSQETLYNSSTFIDFDALYGFLSTSGMVKEILKMVKEKRRDVPVLKFLLENIIKYNDVLHPSQCSSLLYSMSTLSYSDERLLSKICSDLLKRGKYSLYNPQLISIVKSMASIRYKNNDFLKNVCINIVNSETLYSSEQVANIIMSLALLGYESEHVNNLIEKYLPYITIDSIGMNMWLNYVWSLSIFNKANIECVRTVLEDNFVEKLNFVEKNHMSCILKLLNINAYATYILEDYSGPFLSDTVERITNKYSKQKVSYVNVLEDTLKNVVPSPSHFRMYVNTNMGFILDAELYLDSHSRPVCVNDVTDDHKKIAIIVFDYYDLCLGSLEPHGLGKLYQFLLRSRKYDVLSIPYQHFGIEDKLEKRVMYLKHQLWNIHKDKSLESC